MDDFDQNAHHDAWWSSQKSRRDIENTDVYTHNKWLLSGTTFHNTPAKLSCTHGHKTRQFLLHIIFSFNLIKVMLRLTMSSLHGDECTAQLIPTLRVVYISMELPCTLASLVSDCPSFLCLIRLRNLSPNYATHWSFSNASFCIAWFPIQ